MNTPNNKRQQKSKTAIQRAYINLVITRNDISTITVSDICKKAQINRTTFYSHYLDIDDLVQSIYDWMIQEYLSVFKEEAENQKHSFDFVKLFRHIKENQIFYKIYFKLGFDFKNVFLQNEAALNISDYFFKDKKYLDYHVDFFAAGLTAIIQKWLKDDCKIPPEDMGKILVDEYQKKNDLPN